MGIDAFIDLGFSDKDFLRHFLSSPEFTTTTLKKIISSKKTNQSKDDLVSEVERALDNKTISANDILLAYLECPKSWLSFKLGSHSKEPDLEDAAFLLSSFGEEKWYGAINAKKSDKKWYVRVHKISSPSYIGIGEARTLDRNRNIRWIIAAEICSNYIALHWKGFSYILQEESDIRQHQFPYWMHIPKFFDELKELLEGNWEDPNLNKLILSDLWHKYLKKPFRK
ncbi:hypothetical protein [Pseudanabaena sp. PCC 6802]|uniref:hypothetical protein n=1 Tax=Pseudanabaena sp. PCC 6802 TaxID=118173 RepID=UPI00034BD9C9|nr:hypothetical protein [Pseudanabaena sp. PCC 6802]